MKADSRREGRSCKLLLEFKLLCLAPAGAVMAAPSIIVGRGGAELELRVRNRASASSWG